MPRIGHHKDESSATRAIMWIETGQSQRAVTLQLVFYEGLFKTYGTNIERPVVYSGILAKRVCATTLLEDQCVDFVPVT